MKTIENETKAGISSNEIGRRQWSYRSKDGTASIRRKAPSAVNPGVTKRTAQEIDCVSTFSAVHSSEPRRKLIMIIAEIF